MPTKEVKFEPVDLSQLAIQDRKVFVARVVGVAPRNCCRRRG
jgi:hypothetical protein